MSQEAQALLRLLGGSETAHGTWDPGAKANGAGVKVEIKTSARTVREAVTEEMWNQHLAGTRPLGVIPIKDDDTCSWGCIDIDRYDLNHGDLVQSIERAKLPLVVTRSKSGGAHVFLFLRTPAPAGEVQVKLRQLSVRLGLGDCEIFPKQVRILREKGDTGNWLAMPYFGRTGEGVKSSGALMTIGEFIRAADLALTVMGEIELSPTEPTLGDGPPCLGHLTGQGFPPGTRNNGLFALGVYARKKWPDTWIEHMEEMNQKFMKPPISSDEVTAIVRSLEKKDYNYRCSESPLVSHCNRPLCLTRRYGIGQEGDLPLISGIAVLLSDPRVWFVDIGEDRLEMSTDELQNFRLFQKVVMEKLLRVYPNMAQAKWINIVQHAMLTAVSIEPTEDLTTVGQFRETLGEYCTNRQRGRRDEDLLSGRVWHADMEERYYFRLLDLQMYLERHGVKMGRGTLTQRIRDLGGDQRNMRIKTNTISAWWIPMTAVQKPVEVSTPALAESPI